MASRPPRSDRRNRCRGDRPRPAANPPRPWPFSGFAQCIATTQSLQSLNFNVDALTLVENLGTAKRQRVDIVRAVRQNARSFIFDGPTASLTPEETRHLFHQMNTLRERATCIIFISHALDEALELADRITVLRDGRCIGTMASREVSRDDLVRMMIGRWGEYALQRPADGEPPRRGKKLLSVENVTMGSIVKNMSFSLFAGEVAGVFGLVGAGRSEAAQVVCGARKRNFLRGGMIYLRGKPVRDGIAYITEDRKVDGFFETMTVDENIYLGYLSSPRVRRWWYSRSEMKRIADRWIEGLSTSARKRILRIIEYSGGNQHKVVVAKPLAQEPSVVIFDGPTRGVDGSAIPQIRKAIRELAAQGKAVMVISSSLLEILGIADRVLVARGGRIVEEIPAADATQEKIMYAAIH